MFAIFNLGIEEFIILAVLGVLLLGGLTAVAVVLFLANRGKGRDHFGAE
jgi:hypothetical protein